MPTTQANEHAGRGAKGHLGRRVQGGPAPQLEPGGGGVQDCCRCGRRAVEVLLRHRRAPELVEKAQDVLDIRKVLGMPGRDIMIFSKIESEDGVDNFDEILEVSDGIMVARGDLGIEIAPQKVFILSS